VSRKLLREFYDLRVAKDPQRKSAETAKKPTELIVNTDSAGRDTVWNATDKKNITYCVSTKFGSHQPQVIKAMADATGAWERCADVKYVHVAAEDASCTAGNAHVVFDVNPVDVNGEYLARAFFPNEPRSTRNVLIDDTSFDLDPSEKLQLVGVLRHELGHALGLRHEQTRPEAGTCFEDTDWRVLTSYDKFSVMHYPQCNGGGDWSLTLTPKDESGIACLYGPAPGFTINQPLVERPDLCGSSSSGGTPVAGGQPTTRAYQDQRVTAGQEKKYPVFSVKAGTKIEVSVTGHGADAGDPDLYVRFGAPPNLATREWDCRPYLDGPDETCTLDVPAGTVRAYVKVVGYAAGHYDMTVKYTPNH
jgi:hypothetical protein